MNRNVSSVFAAVFGIVSIVSTFLAPASALAGKVNDYAFCNEPGNLPATSHYTGVCMGNFAAFREHSPTDDEASFSTNVSIRPNYPGVAPWVAWGTANVGRVFKATFNDRVYTCSVSSTSPLVPLWDQYAMSRNNWFSVYWNARGECVMIYFQKTSAVDE